MRQASYAIDKAGNFVISNYNAAPTFASFFPGIAGIMGCPMWVFYANRGQCLTSAGVHDKNGAIMEFQPANKAYRAVALQGFRTFLKIDGKYYEPFSEKSPHPNKLVISMGSIKLIEENSTLKIRVEVTYFTVPNENFPGLARVVKVTNLAGKARKIEIIDGLPIIIPFGFDNDLLKKICQTIEAWCSVDNLDLAAPFYKLKVIPADASETRLLEKGNFFLSFVYANGKEQATTPLVCPSAVFGQTTSYELPTNFINNLVLKCSADQQLEGVTPSAFAYKKMTLGKNDSFELCSLFGQADSLAALNQLKPRVMSRAYFAAKERDNACLIAAITEQMKTESASKEFDLYAEQTFLDNIMRGGLPITLDGKIIYLYYRKHGDMERDYNDFKLQPTYFSQGNGNYRDINQNRRNDVFFNPNVAEDNIVRFFNLVQLDGYNPLVVLCSQYVIKSNEQAQQLIARHFRTPNPELPALLAKPFMVGLLLKAIENEKLEYKTTPLAFATDLLEQAEVNDDANHGEGFWIDHAFYNTDLLESFEAIFPDRLSGLLYDQNIFTYFDNDHVVLPRSAKYVLSGGQVRQFQSVVQDHDKRSLINHRTSEPNKVRTKHGQDGVYKTNLMGKLLTIIANKAASFDAAGIGLEMEAEKPDWYDALNGLPGLLGSSLSETLELKRLSQYTLDHLDAKRPVNIPVEVKELITTLDSKLGTLDNFDYWDTATTAKEEYREKTKLGIGGEEVAFKPEEITGFLNKVIARCTGAAEKVLKLYGNYFTYFINEAAEYEKIGKELKIKKFNQRPLPLFLEGFVHALKVEQDKHIPELVRKSPLYDKKLKMFKVNAPLAETSLEIGRARVFTPGWLENESIWLHMEYKYLLELLKAGCYQDFFSAFKTTLVPFMNPKTYKRSILENSSFIVSSANPNKENHGRGFVARLSGGAAEFIDIWLIMMTGKKIFSVDEKGLLTFKLAPILPAWLFKQGKLSFRLFGEIEVLLLNPKKKNTFGQDGVKPIGYKLSLDGNEVEISSPLIKEPYSKLIRERKVSRIVVSLA